LITSQSSLAEVGYCIHVARRLGYITQSESDSLEAEINQVGAPLAGLIRSKHLMGAAEAIVVIGLLLLFGCV
jgi:four helix bundle protein